MQSIYELKMWWRLRRLEKELRATEWFYDKCIAGAQMPTVSDRHWADRRIDVEPLREEIDILLTERLVRKARQLKLPSPKYDDEAPNNPWVESEHFSKYHLSPEAMADLRTAIRREQRERSEALRLWLTVCLSAVAAVTGIAALWIRSQ